ncbi:transcriptional regulator domain-containing protein [Agrobacterium pusense]|uniref:transcriptional regulator domain-containing protein n=1 Tax=Agrobacterium pusense TaxID=648995 RepID=UPI003C7D6886
MQPDISQWHRHDSYDFLDGLTLSGLAWECLRRNREYQRDYATSVDQKEDGLPREIERKWGLKFFRPIGKIGSRPIHLMVTQG